MTYTYIFLWQLKIKCMKQAYAYFDKNLNIFMDYENGEII